MKSTRLIGRTALLAALALTACSSSGPAGNAGSGGTTSATGGATSSGGSTASGGATSSGGATASGGVDGSGGATGSGGIATGGVAGAGSAGASGGGGRATGGIGGGAGRAGGGTTGGAGRSGSAGTSGGAFSLASMHLADGAHFDAKYTCASNNGQLGGGVNPDLEWMNAPAGTMSFAITFLDDTLIAAGMDMYGNHWAMWNIPATESTLAEGTKTLSGTLANAKQSGTFLAPCAQSLMNGMDDQYTFTVYALSVPTITVSGSSTTAVANARTALKNAMTAGQVLATAVLHGHAGLKGM
ncbi:MAG TPA: hypothetical protein VHM31_22400 [Polyangia bacterium]|nr:hypothetical protein [Polyangia bacterium]